MPRYYPTHWRASYPNARAAGEATRRPSSLALRRSNWAARESPPTPGSSIHRRRPSSTTARCLRRSGRRAIPHKRSACATSVRPARAAPLHSPSPPSGQSRPSSPPASPSACQPEQYQSRQRGPHSTPRSVRVPRVLQLSTIAGPSSHSYRVSIVPRPRLSGLRSSGPLQPVARGSSPRRSSTVHRPSVLRTPAFAPSGNNAAARHHPYKSGSRPPVIPTGPHRRVPPRGSTAARNNYRDRLSYTPAPRRAAARGCPTISHRHSLP